MPRSLEEIYQNIANLINESLDEPWVRAWVIARVESDNAEFEYMYQKSTDAQPSSFMRKTDHTAADMYEDFDELRQIMSSSGQSPWKSATFALESDGTFKVDYAYD